MQAALVLTLVLMAQGSWAMATSPSRRQQTAASSIQLPRPFDSSLGNNFTAESCPSFFNGFLSNPVFQSCLPFSLLLQTSGSFFSASSSVVEISQVMDATCIVNYTNCCSLMSSLAIQIRSTTNCGQDLQYQNPLVTQAYNGFLAYDSLYQAGCLKDSIGNYCYGDAMMNLTDPSSSYVYYLPLGVQLPNTTRPSCNECLKNTMAVFAAGASNASKPLSGDYLAAARIVNDVCGPRFADVNIQVSKGYHAHSTSMLLTFLLLLFTFYFSM